MEIMQRGPAVDSLNLGLKTLPSMQQTDELTDIQKVKNI
jgi:hypothetical protein